MIAETEVGHPHLRPSSPGQFDLYVEGTIVLRDIRGGDLALVTYVAAHSVFNLRFGRGARAFGVFLQKSVGIDDGQKLGGKAINFMKME